MNHFSVTFGLKGNFLSIQLQDPQHKDLPEALFRLDYLTEILNGNRHNYLDLCNATVIRVSQDFSTNFCLLYTFPSIDLLEDELTGLMRWFSVPTQDLKELLKERKPFRIMACA